LGMYRSTGNRFLAHPTTAFPSKKRGLHQRESLNQKLVSSNQALWSLRESENAGVHVLALNLQKLKHLSVAKRYACGQNQPW
jgi:hypothetical protein